MEDKILFVMPSINRGTIERAVNSLYNQTDDRWHLCIVYDNVDQPKVTDQDKITCINLTEKLGVGQNGAGNVRNVAIEKFQTKYSWIGFIDDDDTLDKNYVHLLFSKYATYDLVIFRMKLGARILPPENSQDLELAKVGISFCYNTNFDCKFKPSHVEDFHFIQSLKKLGANHIVTDEIGYYVRK